MQKSHMTFYTTLTMKITAQKQKDMITQPDMAKKWHQFHFEPCKEV